MKKESESLTQIKILIEIMKHEVRTIKAFKQKMEDQNEYLQQAIDFITDNNNLTRLQSQHFFMNSNPMWTRNN